MPHPAHSPVAHPFAGPGGWDVGAGILGLRLDGYAVELSGDACRTARAAGFARLNADVRTIRIEDFADSRGAVISAPCGPWSRAGLRLARQNDALQQLLDAITHVGDARSVWDEELGYVPGCGCPWEVIEKELDGLPDERSGLFAQQIRFALGLPQLEWMVCENVVGTSFPFEEIAAELFAAGWESVNVERANAADYGCASNRNREFLLASRYGTVGSMRPRSPIPATSPAAALGWPTGLRMNTRGNRRTSGGNEFTVGDKPIPCLTGKVRGWFEVQSGRRWSVAQAGNLVGFPQAYPWTGSRTSACQQLADAVAPPVAAAVLGEVLGLDWEPRVRSYLAEIYPSRVLERQPDPAAWASPSARDTRALAAVTASGTSAGRLGAQQPTLF